MIQQNKSNQNRVPLQKALVDYRLNRIVSFDVPGHKQGRGNLELTEFLGQKCMSVDVNSMKPLDNLVHPVSVIKDAEELAAEAFGASHAYFMVNGTTSAVQAMIMSVCKTGDKIIMPRNVHRSAINALILTGAVPIYVNPGTNEKLGIPLGMAYQDVETAIINNPDAKAVFINNPTYYGICCDLKRITTFAHEYGMKVLVDEAHGTHFYFGENMPMTAMAAGADFSSISMHKTGGSLTQSSLLLMGKGINENYVRLVINLTQTTSASYLLLSSLDITRRNLAIDGKDIFAKVVGLSEYARSEINKIGGFYAYSKEIVNGDSVFDFDVTKLSIYTRDIGLAGIEVYDILRDNYDIQIEFGDIGNILAIISVGDLLYNIERLVAALTDIKRIYEKDKIGMFDHEYIPPQVALTPQKAFYSETITMPIEETLGEICAEFVMSYPPGIPIFAPGEVITQDALNYIEYAREKGCFLTGAEDMAIKKLKVIKNK